MGCEWEQVILGDLCTKIGSGATPRGGKESYKNEGISLIRSQNVLDYSLSINGLAYIDEQEAKALENVTIQKGDVLLNITGDSVARACIVPSSVLPARVNQHVMILRPNIDMLNNGFLLYLLQYYKPHLLSVASSGATRNALTKAMIENFSFLCPPLFIQEKIAATLACLDEKIELNNKINANLEAQAQAIFKSWFVSVESDSWDIGNLADIAYINPQRALQQQENATYLEMSNLPTQGCFPLGWAKRPYAGGMKFQNGDTLLARITPCLENGKATYVNFLDENETAYGSTEYIVLAPKLGYPSEMLYFLVRDEAFINYAIKNMTGSTGRQRVSGEALGKYEMPIPPLDFLNVYASFFETVMMTIRQNSFQNRILSNIRDTLLPKLMSGEIEVLDCYEIGSN